MATEYKYDFGHKFLKMIVQHHGEEVQFGPGVMWLTQEQHDHPLWKLTHFKHSDTRAVADKEQVAVTTDLDAEKPVLVQTDTGKKTDVKPSEEQEGDSASGDGSDDQGDAGVGDDPSKPRRRRQ